MSVILSLGSGEVRGLNSVHQMGTGDAEEPQEQGPGSALSKGTSSCFEEIAIKLL